MTADGLPRDRDVWRIAAPMILSNISVPMLGMVDTGVVGHLESAVYLGAVAIGGVIFSFLYTGVNFLRMGTTGIAAQRYGADDFDGLRISLGQALVVAQIIAVAVILLQWPVGQVAMKLLGAEGALREHALEYFSIRIWSAPGTLANFVMIGWFLGLQNARVPLIIFLTINLTNIALDLLFVLVLGMKVDGVALASVFAEYTGLAVALYFAARELRKHSGHWPMDKFVNLRAYAAFFSVNANLFVRTMALMFTIAFVTAQGTRMGGLILAANAILMQLQNLTAFGLDGLAHAAEALVGKAVGQRRRVLTDLPAVRETTLRYLPWMIVSPLVSVWSFLYDGVYVGATRAREMRNIMVFSAFAVFIPAWFVLQPLGNDGLWLAFLLFLASRGIGMHIWYRRSVLPAL
jgi:MATE family multidrug resistance protein